MSGVPAEMSRIRVALSSRRWRGNVRELQNTIERVLIVSKGRRLHFDLPLMTDQPAIPMEEQDPAYRTLKQNVGSATGRTSR